MGRGIDTIAIGFLDFLWYKVGKATVLNQMIGNLFHRCVPAAHIGYYRRVKKNQKEVDVVIELPKEKILIRKGVIIIMSFSKNLKLKANDVWEAAYRHPFVQELGQGILHMEKFQFYLLQDYLYLLSYAKVFALGAVKSDAEWLILKFTDSQYNIICSEMNLHRDYMQSFGISKADIDQVKPALFNRTYTASMLAEGQIGDVAAILVAILPCAWSYADFGQRLAKDYETELLKNPYKTWIDMYASADYYESFAWMFEALDDLCIGKTTREKERLEEIFQSGMEFEYLFWEMSYKQNMSY